jgi:hypothetical protein
MKTPAKLSSNPLWKSFSLMPPLPAISIVLSFYHGIACLCKLQKMAAPQDSRYEP